MQTPRPRLIAASLSLLAAAFVAGCTSQPVQPEQPAAKVEKRTPETTTKPQTPSDVTTVTVPPVERKGLPPELSDPKNILSKRSIYFDYDRYDVKDQYKDLVTAHASFLTKHRELKMLVQGNTDERGSREYNLALGQKRADAIKKSLTLLGAREDQVEAVSLGEEKPKSEGHDEAAWTENRRGDMLYSGEY